jgi:hypothetical protein
MKHTILLLTFFVLSIFSFGQQRFVAPQGGLRIGLTTIGGFYEVPVANKSLLHFSIDSRIGYGGQLGWLYGVKGGLSFRHYLIPLHQEGLNGGFFIESWMSGSGEHFPEGGVTDPKIDMGVGVGYRHNFNQRIFLEGTVGNAYRIMGIQQQGEGFVNPYLGIKLGLSLLNRSYR